MLRVIWAFWLISGTWLQTVSAEALSPGVEIRGSQAFFDESFLDLQEELDLAKEEGKIGILIMFEIDDCPFCYRMKHTVLNRSDVQDYFHSYFRILSINAEARLEMTDFSGEMLTLKEFSLKRNRVRATPVFQFYDLQGKLFKNGRFIGATTDADEFLLLGKYFVEQHNKDISFFRFRRSLKETAADGL